MGGIGPTSAPLTCESAQNDITTSLSDQNMRNSHNFICTPARQLADSDFFYHGKTIICTLTLTLTTQNTECTNFSSNILASCPV